MSKVKVEVLEEFHFAFDGVNATRLEVGAVRDLPADAAARFVKEGKVKRFGAKPKEDEAPDRTSPSKKKGEA